MAESYQYRQSYHGSRKVPAAVVGTELEKLRASGPLTPERTIDAAKPKAAPLHGAFEWDDKAAGHEYRLIQARTLIRAVVVVSESSEDSEPQSLYVHVPATKSSDSEYVLLANVADDEDTYARALTEAQRYLTSAEQRFHELRRLAEGRDDKVAAIAIASEGFATVREALQLLKVA